jgi:hypothetical protein
MRHINIPEVNKADVLKAFQKFLNTSRTAEKEIKFNYKLNEFDKTLFPRQKIFFTLKAWYKMTALIDYYAHEVAWHGVVEKHDNYYLVTDILVYPQTASAAYVESDDDEYITWQLNIDDTIINKVRLQGHSHVNMSVNPSGTDTQLYNTLLQGLHDDGWYIFMIMNKRNETFFEIHDVANNVVYEKADIDIAVLLDNKTTSPEWLTAQDKLVAKPKVVTYPTYGGVSTPRNGYWDNDDYMYGYGVNTGYSKGTYYNQATTATIKPNKKDKKNAKKTALNPTNIHVE